MTLRIPYPKEDLSVIERALADGHSKIEITNLNSDNIGKILYTLNSNYSIIPSINKDGNVILDVINGHKTRKIYNGKIIGDAREFLTIILSDMVLEICDDCTKYVINITDNVYNIIKHYSWFDFKDQFLDKGYCISYKTLYKNLIDENGDVIINNIYRKYHKILKDALFISKYLQNDVIRDAFENFEKDVGVEYEKLYVVHYWIRGDFAAVKSIFAEFKS